MAKRRVERASHGWRRKLPAIRAMAIIWYRMVICNPPKIFLMF